MPFLEQDGIQFHYQVSGKGPALVFCHGLTGNLEQSKELLGTVPGFQMIVWDARGHGRTTPAGPSDHFTFEAFAHDLARLLDHLHVRDAIIGGISMGAAVSARYAILHPDRVRALVLVRPAWLDEGLPDGLLLYPLVSEYLRRHGVAEGRQLFAQLAKYQALREQFPDSAATLIGQFSQDEAVERRGRLDFIPRDSPIRSWQEVEALQMPALVVGNEPDVVHPWSYAVAWAEHLPFSRLVKVPSKPADYELHAREVRRHLTGFLEPFSGIES
jgi:pimeloyl-ACP methyl ester carboxylesterase